MRLRFAARVLTTVFTLACSCMPLARAAVLQASDFARLQDVSTPRLSPDGKRIAYSVETIDLDRDRSTTQLWVANVETGSGAASEERQLTFDDNGASNPAWSPDGRSLAFLANRSGDDEAPAQLWLLDLQGGEARQIGESEGAISDFAWSPDGRLVVLVVTDPDSDQLAAKARKKAFRQDKSADDADLEETEPPIVIDRFQFKQDIEGYLRNQRSHLALLDIASQRISPLTQGAWDDLLPAWSPDGKRIAFVSKRGKDPDRDDNWDLYLVEAQAGAQARALTTSPRSDSHPDWESRPAWSPDGKRIAYLVGGDPKLISYATHGLALIGADGGEPKLLTPKLDRNVSQPRWIDGGKALAVLIEQDRRTVLARIEARSGKLSTLIDGGEGEKSWGSVQDFDALGSAKSPNRYALLTSTPARPSEIAYWQSGQSSKPHTVTHRNDALLTDLQLGHVSPLGARTADGTEVHGFLTLPPGAVAGKPLPTVLFIHGGPQSQFEASFRFDWQLFAADGYAVVAMNPRGSTGRGTDYAAAIYANWGGPDVGDVLAGVDAAIEAGVADPRRLAIGGWSYGGMLTNYVIASDTRFKAAVSGASIANVLGGYGTDQYVRDYEIELGRPWEHLDTWLRISYPFLHADRIETPTLLMGGSDDFNVPLHASEQMYQALRSLGVPTQLVIYPGQHHGLDKPSYILDHWQRWLAWYAAYLPKD